jgi:RNA polymerase sigma-70 factor, ECF subfamily
LSRHDVIGEDLDERRFVLRLEQRVDRAGRKLRERRVRRRGAVGAWIMTLARARAIDRLRARQARPDQSRAVEDAAIRPMAAAGDSPEDVIVSSDEARRVRLALDALPEQSRALIDLAYYEGLTHSEIARRTGMPLGTVKTRLRTAMHTLREVLPV